MHVDIDGSGLARRFAVRRYVEGEVGRRLSPFADRIDVVRVRLVERAPSAPTRTFCGIAVTLEPCGDENAGAWALGRAEEDDAIVAIDRALDRVANSVSEEFARRDREQASRARALVAFAQTGNVHRV